MRANREPLKIRYMELLLVFLSTAIGTVVGVAAAVLMMQRKGRSSGMGSDSILRTQLQNTEWALASAGRDVEDLRKQLADREAEAQQVRADLESAQQRLMAASAEVEKESAHRSQADEIAAKAAALAEDLTERLRQLESQVPAAEELSARLEDERRRAAEGSARLTAMEAELNRMRESVIVLEGECAAGRERTEVLTAELDRWREAGGQADLERIALERQCASLEAMLRKERESAAEGMQLLLMAQNKLSGVTPDPPASAGNGTVNGYANGTAA